jgi:hypothetical protein
MVVHGFESYARATNYGIVYVVSMLNSYDAGRMARGEDRDSLPNTCTLTAEDGRPYDVRTSVDREALRRNRRNRICRSATYGLQLVVLIGLRLSVLFCLSVIPTDAEDRTEKTRIEKARRMNERVRVVKLCVYVIPWQELRKGEPTRDGKGK